MKLFDEYKQNESSVSERLTEIKNYFEGRRAYPGDFVRLLGVLDMTTLEGSDNRAKIITLCRQARFSLRGDFPDAAAVCVYPSLVRAVSKELEGSNIRVASVAGAFPSGQSSLHVKLEEIRFAIGEGAKEIDTVISRGKLLEGEDNEVFDELSAMRETCGTVTLKVILETGDLTSISMIRKASEIALLSGADFLKTSTGKIPVGATPEAFLVMADTIVEYLQKTGRSVGIKAAGGIRMPVQAIGYLNILEYTLGENYFEPSRFRIGASSLAGELMNSIMA
jgi:deoxyribose-phosphate aldolase